jgi:hypothetical protein
VRAPVYPPVAGVTRHSPEGGGRRREPGGLWRSDRANRSPPPSSFQCCRDVVPLKSGRLYCGAGRSASMATEGRLRLTKRVRRHRPSRRSSGLQRGLSWDLRWRYSLANRSMWRRAVADGGVDTRRSPHIVGTSSTMSVRSRGAGSSLATPSPNAARGARRPGINAVRAVRNDLSE